MMGWVSRWRTRRKARFEVGEMEKCRNGMQDANNINCEA